MNYINKIQHIRKKAWRWLRSGWRPSVLAFSVLSQAMLGFPLGLWQPGTDPSDGAPPGEVVRQAGVGRLLLPVVEGCVKACDEALPGCSKACDDACVGACDGIDSCGVRCSEACSSGCDHFVSCAGKCNRKTCVSMKNCSSSCKKGCSDRCKNGKKTSKAALPRIVQEDQRTYKRVRVTGILPRAETYQQMFGTTKKFPYKEAKLVQDIFTESKNWSEVTAFRQAEQEEDTLQVVFCHSVETPAGRVAVLPDGSTESLDVIYSKYGKNTLLVTCKSNDFGLEDNIEFGHAAKALKAAHEKAEATDGEMMVRDFVASFRIHLTAEERRAQVAVEAVGGSSTLYIVNVYLDEED